MSAWARPGVKCVKFRVGPPPQGEDVNAVYYNGRHPLNVPVTIKQVALHPRGFECFVIQEYPNWCGKYKRDVGWYAGNFRPLITRTQEQDLELFRPLLTPSPIDVGLVPAGVEFSE